MSGDHNAAKSGPSQRTFEIAIALFFALFGAIIVAGAVKAGITWGFDGPRAGFFPFLMGVLVLIGAGVTLLLILKDKSDLGIFSEWGHIAQVASVALPTLAYIIAIYLIGIYIASALLIAYFMIVLSGYKPLFTAVIAISMPVIIYFVFQKWFLIALPDGLFGEQIVRSVTRLFGY